MKQTEIEQIAKFIYVFCDHHRYLLQNRYSKKNRGKNNLSKASDKTLCSVCLATLEEGRENTRGSSKEGQRIDLQAGQSKTKQILHVRLTEFTQLSDKVESCHDDYLGPHFKLADKLRADSRNFNLGFPAKFPTNVSERAIEQFTRTDGQLINSWSFQNKTTCVWRRHTHNTF